MEAKLVIVRGKANRTEIPLTLPATIGRSRQATLTIAHPMVSRKHCELIESDGAIIVRDLGSLNGTFLGEQRVSEAPVRPDEEFTIGPITFRAVYEFEGDLDALPPIVPAPGSEPADEVPEDEFAVADENLNDTGPQPAVEEAAAEGAEEAAEEDDFLAFVAEDSDEAAADEAQAAADAEESAEAAAELGDDDDFAVGEPIAPEISNTAARAEESLEEAAAEPEADDGAPESTVDIDMHEMVEDVDEGPAAAAENEEAGEVEDEAPAARKPAKKGWWPFGGKPKAKAKPKAARPTPQFDEDEEAAPAPNREADADDDIAFEALQDSDEDEQR